MMQVLRFLLPILVQQIVTSRCALVGSLLFYDVRFGKPWMNLSPTAFSQAQQEALTRTLTMNKAFTSANDNEAR
jgi:hypothetical protein